MLTPPAIVVPCDIEGTFLADDRVEGRARRSTGDTHVAFDLAESLGLRLRLDDRRWTWDVAYTPSLTLPDISTATAPQLLHMGSTHLGWKATRELVLSADADGTYGQENFAYLTPTAGAAGTATTPVVPVQTVQPLPSTQTLDIAAAHGFLSAAWRPARLWDASVRAGYSWSGGLNAASRLVLPQQEGPRADAQVHYSVTREDALGLAAYATILAFTGGTCPGGYPVRTGQPCTPQDTVAEITLTWRHAWSRATSFTLGGGASYARSQLLPSAVDDISASPTGFAAVDWHERYGRDDVHAGADARVMQVVDSLSGVVDLRILPSARLEARRDRTTARLNISGGQSLTPSSPTAAAYVAGTAELAYAATKGVDIAGGLREGWTHETGFPALYSSTAYVSLTVHLPDQRF